MTINGHTEEALIEMCKWLGIDPARVLSFDIFVLTRTAVIKTLDEVVICDLVEGVDAYGKMVFRLERRIY